MSCDTGLKYVKSAYRFARL